MKKVISFLFALYILLLPWQSIVILREIFIGGEKWQYGTIGIYPATLAIIILIGVILLGHLAHKIRIQKIDRPTLYIGMLFIGFSYVSSLWSHDYNIALYNTSLFLLGFFLYILLPQHTLSFKTASLLLLIGASLHSVIALTQFLTQSIDAQAILNISSHLSESGTTATITDITGRWLRAYGGMTHPNILGGSLVLSILLGLHTYVQTRKSYKFMRITLLVSLSLIFIGLIVSFSRSAWIALLVGLITATLILWHKKQSLLRKIQMPLLAFVSIGILFLLFLPQLFHTRSIEHTQFYHNSVIDRTLFIDQAKELLQSAPLTGIGQGNMTITSYKDSVSPLKQIWHYQPVHNIFLLIFTELGIIGFLFFMMLLSIIVHMIWRASKIHPMTHAFFASICIALLVIALFDHWLITSHFGILLFWLLMTLYKNIHKGNE